MRQHDSRSMLKKDNFGVFNSNIKINFRNLVCKKKLKKRRSRKIYKFLRESSLSRLGKPDTQISSTISSSGTVYRDQTRFSPHQTHVRTSMSWLGFTMLLPIIWEHQLGMILKLLPYRCTLLRSGHLLFNYSRLHCAFKDVPVRSVWYIVNAKSPKGERTVLRYVHPTYQF